MEPIVQGWKGFTSVLSFVVQGDHIFQQLVFAHVPLHEYSLRSSPELTDIDGNHKNHQEVVSYSVEGNNNVIWSSSQVLHWREASCVLMCSTRPLMTLYSGNCPRHHVLSFSVYCWLTLHHGQGWRVNDRLDCKSIIGHFLGVVLCSVLVEPTYLGEQIWSMSLYKC